MKTIYVMYNKRTCVTGKALFDELSTRNWNGRLTWRRCNVQSPRLDPDFILRWGNSLLPAPANTVELNTREAVANTTDKQKMLKLLAAVPEITIPTVCFFDTHGHSAAETIVDSDGNVYIRDNNDHIRYARVNTLRVTDKYALRPIEKQREFRVHVFNGNTIGIYEKIPNDPSVKIYKNDTCTFRRVDQADRDVMNGLRGMRPMANAAVSTLGLLFGGVDVLMDANGNFFVTEVNSSPALNEPNIVRWGDCIQDYVTSLLDGNGALNQETEQERVARETETRRVAEQARAAQEAERVRLERERLATARRAAKADLVTRMRALAETEGFEIRNLDLTDSVFN